MKKCSIEVAWGLVGTRCDAVTFPEEIIVDGIVNYNLYFLTPCNLIRKLDAEAIRENFLETCVII
jgi:hypothetical protein